MFSDLKFRIVALALLVSASAVPIFYSLEKKSADRSPASQETSSGPKFTDVVTVLEAQPIENGQLVYWDQTAADALGLKVPPGRVGLPDFETAVGRLVGYEIKQGAAELPVITARRSGNRPNIFVERDAHGGSGRAGYIEVQPDVWVNIKGIGLTGQGNARGKTIGPPANIFLSHSDGSATLEEAIKETVMSRVADAELKRGGGRVLAVFYTGRTLEYPDGKRVPLATIVRVPTRRFDREERIFPAIRTLAEANSRRFMKGDFVNQSNLGAYGEIVDFGCMTHTCGYASLKSSQGETFLKEGSRIVGTEYGYEQAMKREIGKNLVNQLGIPESHIEEFAKSDARARERFESIGVSIRELVHYGQEPTLLDFEAVDAQKTRGLIPWHEYFREAAADWLLEGAAARRAPAALDRIVDRHYARLRSLPGLPAPGDEVFNNLLKNFIRESASVVLDTAQVKRVSDLRAYSAGIREVARFKNRDVPALLRPALFSESGTVSGRFVSNRNGVAITEFIENTVQGNRYSTTPGPDARLITRATPRATEIFFRADLTSRGEAKLFAYPELGGARGRGENFGFRVSTDGWATSQDVIASIEKTQVGDYFKISLPHSTTPFTWKEVEAAPFVREASGNIRWIGQGLNIRGPPLVFNERFGLAPNFEREPSGLLARFGIRTSIHPDDLVGSGRKIQPRDISILFRYLEDPIELVQEEARLELRHSWPKVVEALEKDTALSSQLTEALKSDKLGISSLVLFHEQSARKPALSAAVRADLEKATFRALERGWEVRGVASSIFGSIYPELTPEDRKPYLRALLKRISTQPTDENLIRVLSQERFLALPESDVAISALIKRNPSQLQITTEILTQPSITPERKLKLLEKLMTKPDFSAGIGRLLREWTPEMSLASSIVMRVIESPNLAAKTNIITNWLNAVPVDEEWVRLVNRIVENGDVDEAVVPYLLYRPEVIALPETEQWARTILKRGGNGANQLPNLLRVPNWDARSDLRSSLIQELVDRGQNDKTIIDALAASGGRLTADLKQSQWIIRMFKRKKNSEAILELMRRANFALTPSGFHVAKTVTSLKWLSKATPEQKTAVFRALLTGYGSHPRGMDLLLEVLERVRDPAVAGIKDGLLSSTIWIHHPRVGELLEKLRATDAFGENAANFVLLPHWENHPYQAELIEEFVRAGKLEPGTGLQTAASNPVLEAICSDRPVTISCIKDAFDGGATVKDPLNSTNPAIRAAAAKLTENYLEKREYVDLTSPFVDSYRRYRAHCIAQGLKLY